MSETLTFTIHGLSVMNDRVDAEVFAKKLKELIAGLKSADREGNGRKHFNYVISDLSIGSARVQLNAVQSSQRHAQSSSMEIYEECISSLEQSNFESALRYDQTVKKISELTAGSGKSFSHAELRIGDNVIRIDDFLARQAENAWRQHEETESAIRHFVGVAHGSFDGFIKEVDLRGEVPKYKLVLSAGKVEIDCISKTIDIDEIRAALDRRVWVEGDAVYGGRSGLPERLEIVSIKQIEKPSEAITRWRGSFQPFDISEWGVE